MLKTIFLFWPLCSILLSSYFHVFLFQRKEAIAHRVMGSIHHSLDAVQSLNAPKVTTLFVCFSTVTLDLLWRNVLLLVYRRRRIQDHFQHSGNVYAIYRQLPSHHRFVMITECCPILISLFFLNVQSTEDTRVCFGRSGIHGWGLFARREIQEGEMVFLIIVYLLVHLLWLLCCSRQVFDT